MAKTLMNITVRGQRKEWSFNFYGDQKHLDAWHKDGLNVHVIINSVPVWVNDLGLSKVWFFFQDLFCKW